MKYITPLKEKPEVVRETTRKPTEQAEALQEFANSDVLYAKLNPELLGKYKTPQSCARGLGRIVKTLKLEVKVYSDSENVYLEKLNTEGKPKA